MAIHKKYYKEATVFKNKGDLIDKIFKPTDNALDVGFWGQGITRSNKSWGHDLIRHKVKYLFGIDLSEEIKSLDKQLYNYEVKNAEEFNYEHKFNTIYAGDLIEHVSNPGKFLESCKKSLSENGTIIISTPNTFNLFNIIEKIFKTEPTINHDHVAYYNIKTLNTLLTRHNLLIKKIGFIHSLETKYKQSSFKKIQNFIYFILSLFTNKYLETLVLFIADK